MIKVMLCLRVYDNKENTTLSFNFETFFGENGKQQFLATVNLFFVGNNDSKWHLLS